MTTGRRVRGAGVPNAGLRSIPPPCGTRCGCTGYAPPTRAPRSTRTRYSTAAATSPRRRSCPRPSCCLSRARTCSGRHPPRKGTRRRRRRIRRRPWPGAAARCAPWRARNRTRRCPAPRARSPLPPATSRRAPLRVVWLLPELRLVVEPHKLRTWQPQFWQFPCSIRAK